MVPRAGVPLFNWVNALPAVGTSKHSTPFLGILWTVDPTNLAIGAAFVKVKKLPAAQQRAYAGNFTVLLLVDNAHLMSMSSRPGTRRGRLIVHLNRTFH